MKRRDDANDSKLENCGANDKYVLDQKVVRLRISNKINTHYTLV